MRGEVWNDVRTAPKSEGVPRSRWERGREHARMSRALSPPHQRHTANGAGTFRIFPKPAFS